MNKTIDYRKILNQLLRDYPHDLDKIEKVIKDAKENICGHTVNISFKDILTDTTWNAEEKARLINIFGYNKEIHIIEYNDYARMRCEKQADVDYLIQFGIDSGFEALMKSYQQNGNEPEDNINNSIGRDTAYRRAISSILRNCEVEKRRKYLKYVLDNLSEDDFKRLFKTRYVADYASGIWNRSIFVDILASKDFGLVKKYIKYVDDINTYMSDAVGTGNIDIVKLFLEKGADINYLPEEECIIGLTPLKTAIMNNDYKMAEFLIKNGADVTLQTETSDFFTKLKNPKIYIADTMNMLKDMREDNDNVAELKYVRESSPLEFATKLSEHYRKGGLFEPRDSYFAHFDGEPFRHNNGVHVETYGPIKDDVINRGKIIDLIYDSLEDKSKVDYTYLLIYNIISQNNKNFDKYAETAKTADYPINFDLLFKLYFELTQLSSAKITNSLFKLIDKYDESSDLYIKLMNSYLSYRFNQRYVNDYKFSFNKFTEKLLNKIPEEKRKEIPLVPLCENLQTLQSLINLGFDINQEDKNGKNILYNLLIARGKKCDLTDKEMELFDYLLENMDLSKKDDDNKTILYYAMQQFPTEGELDKCNKEKTLTKIESAVVKLITKMKEEDVCNDDIKLVLESRIDYNTPYGDQIVFGQIYNHHRELFEALINKGFVFSDKILEATLRPFYEDYYKYEARGANIDKSLEFIYRNMDRNTEIQNLPIEAEFEELMNSLNYYNQTSFEDFAERLKEFNKKNQMLDEFYEKNITAKFNPEYYLDFAKKKYSTIYGEEKATFIPLLVLKATNKFGFDKLPEILDQVPDYDINSYVVDADIGYSYWTYHAQIVNIIDLDEDGTPIYGDSYFPAKHVRQGSDDQVWFTGGLMQYAILTDNLPMVKYLQEKGASLELTVDGEKLTWDYVNSYNMLGYLESYLGSIEYSDLSSDEVDYFKELFDSEESSEQEKPKVMVKKDDSESNS